MTTLVDRSDFGPAGRRALPLDPPSARLEDVTVRLAVDPVRQNWVHLILDGDDGSPYKTMLLVDGEQASYRDTGDPEPIDMGSQAPVPGGILISTALLPLTHTQSRESVEITLRTYRHSYRTAAEVTGTEVADRPSRRYLAIETHTAAIPKPLPEAPARTDIAPMHLPSDDVRSLTERRSLSLLEEQKAERQRIADAATAGRLPSIERYRDELRFLLETIEGPLANAGPSPRDLLQLLIATIDAHACAWSQDVTLIATGGHQSDWGGYHSALGEALYLAEPFLRDDSLFGSDAFEVLLDEPFLLEQGNGPDALSVDDSLGTSPTRRDVWELLLAANFDFARSRLSYIFNQVLYTYEGAWKAHEGLRVIGSPRYEGVERSHRIVREAWGIAPFLGEEVLVGPDGQALDLFHSLFHHDRNAVLTDDVRRIVMTGRARTARDAAGNPVRRRPYGDHYRGTTERGLPRENSYVGVYGEAMNYLPGWVRRLSQRSEDAPLRDDLVRLGLRNIEARSWMRYPDIDSDGRDVMRMEQAIDDRNPAMPGRIAYLTESTTGTTLAWVGLALDVLSAKGSFASAEWAEERKRAGSLLTGAHQELDAGHLLDAFDLNSDHPAAQRPYLLRIAPFMVEALAKMLSTRHTTTGEPAGELLPHSPAAKKGRRTFTDIDALVASLRDGQQHLWMNLCSRSLGFSGTGRFHLVAGRVHVIGTLAVHGVFSAQRVHIRGESGEQLRQLGEDVVAGGAPFAWFGHLQPVTYQPGVGTTRRENVDEDTPYSAYPDLVWARCGDVLVAANTTRIEYGNARPLTLELAGGERILQPREMAVLPAPSPAPVPDPVRAVIRTDTPSATGLAWSPTGGARSYDVVNESTGEVLAAQVTSTRIVFDAPVSGSLRVDAHNGKGRTRGSMSTSPRPIRLRRPDPHGDGVLVGEALGEVTGQATGVQRFSVREGSIAHGDDSRLDQRHRPDAMGFVPVVKAGSFEVTCTVVDAAGPLGLMVRSTLDAVSPALIVLSQPSGEVVVQLRDTHTREDFGAGNPGEDARGGVVRSPRRLFWSSPTSASTDMMPAPDDSAAATEPGAISLRIRRDSGRGVFTVEARRGNELWSILLMERLPLPEVVLAGSCALGSGVTETYWGC